MTGIFFLLSLGILASCAAVAFSRYARAAVGWGALVGAVLGFWILGPRLIAHHHFAATAPREWVVVDAFLLVTFSVIGASIALAATPALAILERASRAGFRAPWAAILLWTIVWLPPGYVLLSAAIEWSFFSKHAAPDFQPRAMGLLAGVFVAFGLAMTGIYRATTRRTGARSRQVVLAFVAAAAAGAGVLPFRAVATAPERRRSAWPVLERKTAAGHAAPLLVIGLDGGNWRTLQPLIASGRAPTFARLASSGITGTVRAEWPPYWSTPAWGAILTGHDADEIGVHEDAAASAPGLPSFELPLTLNPALNPIFLVELALVRARIVQPSLAPRTELRVPPIWERLDSAGVRTAVIAFPFTYPVNDRAAYIVSNRVATDLWEMLGIDNIDPRAAVGPRADAPFIVNAIQHAPVDASAVARVAPPAHWPVPADAIVDPGTVVPKVMDTSERMFAATEAILRRDPSLNAVMFYTPAFDTISHAFWQYRFPGDYADRPPAPRDVAALSGVIDRYLEYLDGRIATLISAFPEPPNVVVVSDHGEEASRIVTLWRGWHGPEGLFIAAGPDIRPRGNVGSVSYFDVAPTLLDLLRVAPAPDLEGRTLLREDAAASPRARP